MTEKVIIGNCELWHGDCREVLPLLPPVDLVLTDPPYGQGKALATRREQMMANDDFLKVSEVGEGQDKHCPVCGAEPGQMCSGNDPDDPDGPLGVEYGRHVHRARLSA